MKTTFISTLVLITVMTPAHSQTAEEHFNEVVANVKNSDGLEYSYYGVYPGMTREEGLKVAKSGDKIIALHEDPSTKGHLFFEVTEPKMQISITSPNLGRDVPESRSNSEIRSPLVKVKRIAPRNATFDKELIIDEIESQLGTPTDYDQKGPTHRFYFGFNPKKSRVQLHDTCSKEFKNNNPDARVPSEMSRLFMYEITIEATQHVMTFCPSTLEFYKSEKTKELSPWVWITFNEKKRDFNILMNYQGEEYLSPDKKDGPLYKEE
ncbi:MAG: hypothetical protein AAF410_05135 [Pseudomonadota bacterium]